MSTRQLYVVVIILLVIDLVAGIWYFSGRLSDPEFMIANNVIADTTAQGDRYIIKDNNGYYRSRNTTTIASQTDYLTSAMRVKVKWPMVINGNDNLSQLIDELNRKMWGADKTSVDKAMDEFVAEPHFNTSEQPDYVKLDIRPVAKEKFSNIHSLKAFPVFTSDMLIVFEVVKRNYDGVKTSERTAFVNYDRVNHRVIAKGDVVGVSGEDRVLAIINSELARNYKGLRASALPAEIRLARRGVNFVYSPAELQTAGDKDITVYVKYSYIYNYMSAEVARIVDNNDNFDSPAEIKF